MQHQKHCVLKKKTDISSDLPNKPNFIVFFSRDNAHLISISKQILAVYIFP